MGQDIVDSAHPRLALRDALLVAVHERRNWVAPCLLQIPLPEHLLLQQVHPAEVHVLGAGQVAQVRALEGHLQAVAMSYICRQLQGVIPAEGWQVHGPSGRVRPTSPAMHEMYHR